MNRDPSLYLVLAAPGVGLWAFLLARSITRSGLGPRRYLAQHVAGTLRQTWQDIRDFTVRRHLWQQYTDLGLYTADPRAAHQRGWTPQTLAELKPYTGAQSIVRFGAAAMCLTPDAFHAWFPHLPPPSHDGPVTAAVATRMQQWWEAAGDLAPEAARAGLTIQDARDMAASGDLTAQGLELLAAFNQPAPAWPWRPQPGDDTVDEFRLLGHRFTIDRAI